MSNLRVAYINNKKIADAKEAETGEEILSRFFYHQEVIRRNRLDGEKPPPDFKLSKKQQAAMTKAWAAQLRKKWEARDLKKAQAKWDKEKS